MIREEIAIHIIQSRDHILNTFDSKISEYAESRFEREHIDVITNSRVLHIEENEVFYKTKPTADQEAQIKSIPFGLCLWSTGIGNVYNIIIENENKSPRTDYANFFFINL